MKWIEIDKDDWPTGTVLAANFNPSTYGYREKLIGVVYKDKITGKINCSDGHQEIQNCTHYIKINDFDIKE